MMGSLQLDETLEVYDFNCHNLIPYVVTCEVPVHKTCKKPVQHPSAIPMQQLDATFIIGTFQRLPNEEQTLLTLNISLKQCIALTIVTTLEPRKQPKQKQP